MQHVKPRLYRDPVHDTVAFAPDRPEGRLVIELLDTQEMQRLRRVRQLALSNLVYHGAEHTRFTHSVGVAWVTWRMLEQLRPLATISTLERLEVLSAAVLHDVGHAPFSHALEVLSGACHEHRASSIILDPSSEVHDVLASFEPSLPSRVASMLSGASCQRPFLRDIVSSQLDADRFDYILRDGRMTGVKIGQYDLERILATLAVHDDHLAVHCGGQAAVEGYLLARFHMYQQVYLHKASRIAERMLVAALERARVLHDAENDPGLYWPAGGLGALITGATLTTRAFTAVDDLDVWFALKRWSSHPDPILSSLSAGLVNRRLWKSWSLQPGDGTETRQVLEVARDVARAEGFEPEHYLLVDESSDSPYRPFVEGTAPGKSIRMVARSGDVTTIEERSEVVRMLGQITHVQRLLIAPAPVIASLRRALSG